jgi:hypothetical protein
MKMTKQTKSVFTELLVSFINELFYSEEPSSKKKYKESKYYTNPFGGFLP